MAVTLVLVNVICIACLCVLSHKDTRSALKGGAIHPYNLVASALAIVTIDFMYSLIVLGRGEVQYISNLIVSDIDSMRRAFAVVTIYNLSFLVGIYLTLLLIRRSALLNDSVAPNLKSPYSERAAWATFTVSSALGLMGLAKVIAATGGASSVFYVTATRQSYYGQNPLEYIMTIFVAPAYAVLIQFAKPKVPAVFICAAICCSIIILSGSRNQILFILFVLAADCVRRWGSPRFYYLLLAIPLAALMTIVLQFVQRGWSAYSSVSDMIAAENGIVGYLFGTPEIAFAEIMTIILQRSDTTLAPFSSILAGLLRPIPRALIDIKPVAPSSYFTATIDPSRWADYSSELSISGYGNLYLEFGVVGGALVGLVLAAAWAAGVCIAVRRFPTSPSMLWSIYLTWFALMFIRSDLYVVSFSAWPIILTLGAFFMFRWVIYTVSYKGA